MIDHLFQITLSNISISLVLAIVAVVVGKTLKRPMITYLLWLLVFLKLLTPPFFTIPVNSAQWFDSPTPSAQFSVDEQQAMQSTEFGESSEIINLPSQKASIASLQGKHWLLMLWGVGSLAVFIWSILQVYRFHRLLKKESEIADPEIQSKAVKIAIRMGLNAVPIIQITSANISPMVWWIGGKVWIVIPASLIKQMDPGQFEYILSHELAHVCRRDYMIRWVEWVVCVCFWWNPVTWWARYNLRASEELCCDALVLSSMKPKPYSYGDSLLKAIEILSFPNQHPAIIASGINDGKSLKRRIKMIISNDLFKSKLRWLQVCIIFGGLVILPLGLMSAQDSDSNKKAGMFDENMQSDGSWLENMKAGFEELNKAVESVTSSKENGKTAKERLYDLQWIEYRIEKYLGYVEAQIEKAGTSGNVPGAITKENIMSLKGKLKKLQARLKEEISKTRNSYGDNHIGSLNAQNQGNNKQGIMVAETAQTNKSAQKNTEAFKTRNTSSNRIGDHNIVIVSTAGRGTVNSTNGKDSLYFEDGNCSVQLKGEILTVNGEEYHLSKKSDSIYVEDNLVKVNGKTVSSKK